MGPETEGLSSEVLVELLAVAGHRGWSYLGLYRLIWVRTYMRSASTVQVCNSSRTVPGLELRVLSICQVFLRAFTLWFLLKRKRQR